jgi:hypothetical protein
MVLTFNHGHLQEIAKNASVVDVVRQPRAFEGFVLDEPLHHDLKLLELSGHLVVLVAVVRVRLREVTGLLILPPEELP